MKSKTIAISLGDPGGIGAEITLKAIVKPAFKNIKFMLFGNADSFDKKLSKDFFKMVGTKVAFHNIHDNIGKIKLGEICAANGKVAIKSLDLASCDLALVQHHFHILRQRRQNRLAIARRIGRED